MEDENFGNLFMEKELRIRFSFVWNSLYFLCSVTYGIRISSPVDLDVLGLRGE